MCCARRRWPATPGRSSWCSSPHLPLARRQELDHAGQILPIHVARSNELTYQLRHAALEQLLRARSEFLHEGALDLRLVHCSPVDVPPARRASCDESPPLEAVEVRDHLGWGERVVELSENVVDTGLAGPPQHLHERK